MVTCPLCDTEVPVTDPASALAHFDECPKVPRLRPATIPTRAARLTDRLIGYIANALPTKS